MFDAGDRSLADAGTRLAHEMDALTATAARPLTPKGQKAIGGIATQLRAATDKVSVARRDGQLLRLGGTATDTSAIEQAARRRKIPFEVFDVPASEVRDLYERDLVLVRPDQYVAWRGSKLPPDSARLLAQIAGAT